MKLMTQAVIAVSVSLSSVSAFAQTRVAQAAPEPAPAAPAPAAPAPAAAAGGDVYAPPTPPPPPPPPPAPLPPPPPTPSVLDNFTFALHGFAGVSLYVQDSPQFVLNGQGPLLLVGPTPNDGGYTTGADIRQSRFNFSVAGPKVFGGATPKAVLEFDLFGLNSPGGYGEVSAYQRVRLAYAELKWEHDVIRFGQDHELILGLVNEGLGHLAYPVTYFAGSLGWREPGIGYFHTIPLGESSKLELSAQVIKSDWESPTDFGVPSNVSNLNDLSVDLGQLSGLFGFEARAKFTSPHVMAFVAGHWNHVEGTHAADTVAGGANLSRNWSVEAATAGVKLTFSGLTVQGFGYVGENLGPLLGEGLQFFTSNDIFEWGAWGQVLYSIIPQLNISAIVGTSQPRGSDLQTAVAAESTPGAPGAPARASNTIVGGMIRYQDGGFAVGPEFHHVIATQMPADGNAINITANQFMLSGMYFF
jgi:hypothetical protein